MSSSLQDSNPDTQSNHSKPCIRCRSIPGFGTVVGIYLAILGIVITILAVGKPELFIGYNMTLSLATLVVSIILLYVFYELSKQLSFHLQKGVILDLTQQIKAYLDKRFLSQEPLTDPEFWDYVYSTIAEKSCKLYIDYILNKLTKQGYINFRKRG